MWRGRFPVGRCDNKKSRARIVWPGFGNSLLRIASCYWIVAGGAEVIGADDRITPFAGVGVGGAPSEGGTDADGAGTC